MGRGAYDILTIVSMLLPERIAILTLVFLWAGQIALEIWGRFLAQRISTKRWLFGIAGVSLAAIFATASWWSYLQYRYWASNEFTKAFLPPHQSIWYFIDRIIVREMVGPWFVALAAAALGFFALQYLNRRHGELFFEREEYLLFAIGIFFSGYPGFLIYVIFMMLGGLILTITYTSLRWGRAPLMNLWLPIAIFGILVRYWYVPQALLSQFRF